MQLLMQILHADGGFESVVASLLFPFSAVLLTCECLETHSMQGNGLICNLSALPLHETVAVVVRLSIAKCLHADL